MSGNLTKDIAGNGTTVLQSDVVSANNGIKIAGTIDGNGKTIDLTTSTNYNKFSVGGFKGTTNLKINVDMTTVSDKAKDSNLITLTGTSIENAIVDLTSINVTNLADAPDGGEKLYTDYVTYLNTSGAGTFENLTLKLNGNTAEITTHAQVGDVGRDYTFTLGSDGSLNVLVKDTSLTLERFITGETNTPATTYSLNSLS